MIEPLKVKDGSQPIKIMIVIAIWIWTMWAFSQITYRLDNIIQNQQTTINAINKGIIPNL